MRPLELDITLGGERPPTSHNKWIQTTRFNITHLILRAPKAKDADFSWKTIQSELQSIVECITEGSWSETLVRPLGSSCQRLSMTLVISCFSKP